jgi:hypothetical protein
MSKNANIPLDVFKPYFKLTMAKYKDLESTERGIVLSLAKYHPDKFKSKALINYITKNDLKKEVTKDNTPLLDTKKPKPSSMKKRMAILFNQPK